ncbi:RagB/SusD family nutrient uptake outer membrane protein [Porifericola rhodea]|uniref:RagB/SusD family nutrient uptake outer membrane protein n=1 Tax=Porifericola rhodea TaxID=930972 RepID=UPI002665C9A6|nr:RagB/SusD family nutrient uptake outer membrane protein [Porifericola rhodea]WKN31540.1 RagB/SusD family nutrient uptake outer membrane protein [Porifericola rhodea]
MKSKLLIISVSLLAFFSQSCEEYLKEELVSDVSAASYYTTPQGFEDAVKATYAEMKNFYGPEIGFTMTVFGTDVHTNGADGSHKAINRYDGGLNPEEGFIRDTWTVFYRGINQANAVINRAGDVEIEDELKNQRLAEVRFLRALYYFNLTRIYGDIHLSLEETEGIETTANKTPASEIYSQAIIPDLEFAISILPNSQADLGRVTKPAAEYLLGLALLTRSYTDFSASDDASRAEGLFSNIINNYDFELANNYLDLWGLDTLGVSSNISSAEDNPEIIFAVQNSKNQVDEGLDGQGHRGHLYFLMEYDKLPGMTRDVENGRPWKRFRPTDYQLSLWNRDIDRRYDETYKHVWYANNESNIPVWTQDEANAGYLPDGASVGDLKFNLGDTAIYIPGPGLEENWDAEDKFKAPYIVVTPNPQFDTDPWFYSERVYPTLNKFIDNTRPNRQHTQGQRDFYLMRLGEVYLLRAEARIKLGNTAGAAEDINVIRRRAAWEGMEDEMTITPAEATLEFLLEERAREMDGEGHRWFTLARTETLVERVRMYNPEAKDNIQDHHIIRPIPLQQIDRTEGGYPQNPGYPGASDAG